VSTGLTLICPVRGRLKAKARSADGLNPSEERLRVDAIRHLVAAGYPKENIWVEAVIKRFGSGGRNSFRADLVVLDKPTASVESDPDVILEHAVVIGEVKRDNAAADAALAYQVRPMLDFSTRTDCVALYWDDVEQRVFWYEHRARTKSLQEGPLASLPGYGNKPSASKLTLATIDADKPLLGVFTRIEDILHAASLGPQKRFGIILQLLLAKLHDEHLHASTPDDPLIIQDFRAIGTDAFAAKTAVDKLLSRAVRYYQGFLPEKIPSSLDVDIDVLMDVFRVLAPVKITEMEQRVIQDFYMYFGKHIYKWDLAQYFTPTSVTDFIVEVLNPQQFEHIKDPACGSADFLTAAFRRGKDRGWSDYASCIHGTDVSREAVQVAVLNMILNGDGKTNIDCEDSLVKIVSRTESADVVVCNPPFGSKILERKPDTLANFDLGRGWSGSAESSDDTDGRPTGAQQSGILFAEACVRLLRSSPQGRFALVVPNGYLGNRSQQYRSLREWLLLHCRIAVIVALPRFTFKSSGADVSASVIFCQKRDEPLTAVSQCDDYDIAVEVVDRVGWNLQAKKAEPVYRRDPKDGTLLVDESGDLIVDSDFAEVLGRIRSSAAAEQFDWLTTGITDFPGAEMGWTVSAKEITADPLLTLDPKRLCRKHRDLVEEIRAVEHYRLGDIAEFVPESQTSDGSPVFIDAEKAYNYVEIADVGVGTYRTKPLLGWELPSRARHHAEPRDIYLGAIWSSVTKWCMVGDAAQNIVVTNGLRRIRLKPGMDKHLPDLVIALCSEGYATQMRALARGSDGLAEISEEDMNDILIPRIKSRTARAEIAPYVEQLLNGVTTLESKVTHLISNGRVPISMPSARPSHTSII